MARTRAQDHAGDAGTQSKKDSLKGKATEPMRATKAHKESAPKRKAPPKEETPNDEEPESPKSPPTKRARTSPPTQQDEPQSPSAPPDPKSSSTPNPKLEKLLSTYGSLPIQDLGISDPAQPTPSTMLAHVFNAMLTSARISHELATKSVKCLIEANYHDLETLKRSSWEERTEVLTKGGYTRYREKTATGLGDLAEFVAEKYDGDLNNVLAQTDSSPAKVRAAIKEIKGLGDVGVNIFFDTAQAAWPCLAPFVDPRSLKTAEHLGLGRDVGKLYAEVERDPVGMCKLAAALTTVRLEKREGEFV